MHSTSSRAAGAASWGFILAAGLAASAADVSSAPRTRKFQFSYDVTITELKPGSPAHIWLPLAASDADQRVVRLRTETPGARQETKEARFGNGLLYVEAAANAQGQIPLLVEYEVERREVTPTGGPALRPDDAARFLKHDALAPADGSTLRRLLGDAPRPDRPADLGRLLYEKVDGLMEYKKIGTGWGRGDVRWACDARYGNCCDFHSVFLAACRDAKVAGRFEMGFPLPTDAREGTIPGYHCWARFADGDRWLAVDISEADKNPKLKDYYFGHLTPDRVRFTIGRDLELTPPPKSGPVNFLIYPLVEVEGAVHAARTTNFRFVDLP